MRSTLTAALISLAALAGCAAQPERFAGISLDSARHPPEVRSLAERAAAGDKMAQLELGIRYEEGRGLPVSRQRAERLYRMAATYSGGGRAYEFFRPMRPGGRSTSSRSRADGSFRACPRRGHGSKRCGSGGPSKVNREVSDAVGSARLSKGAGGSR